MKIFTALSITAVLLLACAPSNPIVSSKARSLSGAEVAMVKKVTVSELDNPESTQFRNLREVEHIKEDGTSAKVVCGQLGDLSASGQFNETAGLIGSIKDGKFELGGIREPRNIILQAFCPR